MKRHKPQPQPRLHAPGVAITQEEGGGFTIAHEQTGISGARSPSLDAAWKSYKAAVLDSNAADSMAREGHRPKPTDHLVERKRLARMIKKTERLRENAASE